MQGKVRQRGFVAALGLLATLLVAGEARAVNDLRLNVAPGSTDVRPGNTVTVTLDVSNLSAPINGVQALIGYDDALLELQQIMPTDLGLLPPAEGWVEVHETNVGGDITYAIIINGASTIVNQTVATLTFLVIEEGSTTVFFRPDSGPFSTKLTVAADNSTLLPTKADSGVITSACDDGLFCNGLELFDGVACQPGTDPCDDGVACTIDACDEILDLCTNTPDDSFCDDGLFCNGTEFCDPVLDCQPGVDPCDDGVVCTIDTCDEDLDLCTNTPDDSFCDDGLFCNGAEFCDPVLDCQPGVDPCDDGVACTIDTCDEALDLCTNDPDDTFCDNGVFCDGAEFCDPVLDCQPGSDPCAPLLCDEPTETCLAPGHIAGLEIFYAGRYSNAPNPARHFLASGSTATTANITNYTRGITGIRVIFDEEVAFATTAAAAFSFEWTTGTGTTFAAVTDAATNITVTPSLSGGVTVVDIVLANDFARRRWLKVTMDASQVTVGGVALDGELTGNPISFPSGDGFPGGNAVFYLGNLPGDVDGDRRTTLTDVGIIRAAVNPFVSVPITSVNDVDKDGRVILTDVGLARADVNPFFTLPLIAP